jgi:RNA polymerase sigma factor (sigma-70 family)
VIKKTETQESELVEGCIRQDRNAQKQLYELYKKAMFSVAFRILNDMDNAHDVLQDGFLEVFRDIGSFRKDATLGAWIKVIIVRKALQKLKLESRFETLDIEQHDSGIAWPDNLTGEYLDKAIRALPAGYRAVFNLVEVEGYTHKEVAQLLQISEGTSKSQLYHAKKMLQKKLTDLVR